MSREEKDLLWEDPQHWDRRGLTYSCPRDPRLMVPKREGGGWTLNMGHRRAQSVAWLFLLCVIAAVGALGIYVARTT